MGIQQSHQQPGRRSYRGKPVILAEGPDLGLGPEKLMICMLKKGLSPRCPACITVPGTSPKDSAGPSPSVSQAPGHLGSLSLLLKQMPEEAEPPLTRVLHAGRQGSCLTPLVSAGNRTGALVQPLGA